jgi:hypothetical protein
MNTRGKSSKELKQMVADLSQVKANLEKKVASLEKKISSTDVRVKVVTKQKTKTENFPEGRKVALAKAYAKQYIDDKVKSSFNTKISDLSKVLLTISDFCTEHKLPLRQLGILLYASNFRSVRKKDLHVGRNTGTWYSQTVEAMIAKGLLMRVNPDMKKWIYFAVTPEGERLVRNLNVKVKEYLVEDDKETEGIKRRET